MPWRDTLQSLQSELAQVRDERLRLAREDAATRQDQRDQITNLASSLRIAELVGDMNAVLLQGKGTIETYSSWDPPSEETDQTSDLLGLDDDGDEDDADYISSILSWEEDGEREIAVDLGISEEGVYLQVNELEIRPEQEALEQALLAAFREELQV
jgi:hypothetical protein